jgi:methionyl-tRNA formyltransferase
VQRYKVAMAETRSRVRPLIDSDATVLFLGPEESRVLEHLRRTERNVVATAERIEVPFVREVRARFAVSHGYRHLVKKPVLDFLMDRVINLHISYLPWNRGADPNLWSIIDGTPKGVSIHYMDDGLDTGDIIAQQRVEFASGDTLHTSYDKLQEAMYRLFVTEWPLIRMGQCARYRQPPGGSVHRARDKARFGHLLAEWGWDAPIDVLRRLFTTEFQPPAVARGKS